jgi:hypothetical protein
VGDHNPQPAPFIRSKAKDLLLETMVLSWNGWEGKNSNLRGQVRFRVGDARNGSGTNGACRAVANPTLAIKNIARMGHPRTRGSMPGGVPGKPG